MLDPLVRRDLALLASGKTPVGDGGAAMAQAILVLSGLLEALSTPPAAPLPDDPDPSVDQSPPKEDK